MILIIAFITMTIDHIGLIFFPGEEILRIIGRISFPLFAWGIVRGYKLTKSKEKYMKRIFLLAIISQFLAYIVFLNDIYNILFTLLFGLFSLKIIEEKSIYLLLKPILIFILLYISIIYNFDYGPYGILTIIILYFFWQQKKSIIFFSILTIFFYNINYSLLFTEDYINNLDLLFNFHIQLYSIISIFIIYFTPIQKYDFKLNFYFKYGFYPIHLIIFYIIKINFLN